MENMLLYIKECFKEFEYPNIYSMSENEFTEIFAPANRLYLFSWFSQKFNGDSEEVFSEEILIEFITTYGFCSRCQVKKFVDGLLDPSDQIKIIYKMCNYLKELQKSLHKEQSRMIITNEDVANLISKDLNIFKTYGPIKTGEGSNKFKLTQPVDLEPANKNHIGKVNTKEVPRIVTQHLREILNNLPVLKEKIAKILRYKNGNNETINLDKSSISTLVHCNEGLSKIEMYIQNIETTKNFNQDVNSITFEMTYNEEFITMISDTINLIHEIDKLTL